MQGVLSTRFSSEEQLSSLSLITRLRSCRATCPMSARLPIATVFWDGLTNFINSSWGKWADPVTVTDIYARSTETRVAPAGSPVI